MKDSSRKSPTTNRPHSELAIGWLTMFMVGSDLFVVSPLLPLIANDYAISPALAGLSVTVFSLVYTLCAPLLGNLADRIGRGRMLVYCLCAFAVANMLTAASGDLTCLTMARSLAGAAAAGVSPSVYALISGNAPFNRRATWLSIVVSGLLISLSFGAPMGGLIGATFGWRIVFTGLAVLSLLLAWANISLWRNHCAAATSAGVSGRLAISAIISPLAPTVVWSTAVYTTYTYLGDGLSSLSYSTEDIAGVIAFYGSGAFAGVLIGGRMTDRFGAGRTSAIGLGGLCCCLFLLRLSLDACVLVGCCFALLSLVAQLFFPAQQVRLAHAFPGSRATILAWNNSALFLGISFGSLIGGQAISAAGYDLNLMVSAAIAFVGWLINQGGRPTQTDAASRRQPRPAGT